MCKFESDSAPGFDLVAEAVQRYADEAPTAIRAKWGSEAKERVLQRVAAVEQLIPGKCFCERATSHNKTDQPR